MEDGRGGIFPGEGVDSWTILWQMGGFPWVSINGCIPRWMVYFMENLLKMDDLEAPKMDVVVPLFFLHVSCHWFRRFA